MTELEADSVWFYTPQQAEIVLEVDGKQGTFVLRGLSSKEQEKLGSKSYPVKVDERGRVKVGEMDGSLYIDHVILESLVKAPFPITLENVQRLKGPLRRQLFEKAVELSDSSEITEEIKKKL